MQKFLKLTTALMVISSLSACVVHIGNERGYDGRNIDTSFGNIDVDDYAHAGNLDAVNGNVTIGNNANVEDVDVVNGNIEIGDKSSAQSLETVNGNIVAGQNVKVDEDVSTVNGNIEFGTNSRVGDSISTVTGDIYLAENTQVLGDITFEKRSKWEGFFKSVREEEQPELKLEQGVRLQGKIHLYRYVNLNIPSDFDRSKIIRHYGE